MPRVKAFVSFVLTFLILISSINWKISAHYCGDKLVSIGIQKSAPDCGMESADGFCPSSNKIKNQCCQQIDQLIDAEETVRIPLRSHPPASFVSATFPLLVSSPELFNVYRKLTSQFWGSSPPYLMPRVYSLIQVFRL
ncbi:hypothetical protein KFE98_02685 [bacterium SCSIO 12741]|nr:hypothetical protein KFE98_02685 [bacterium SCSIO 12741]